MRTLELNKSTLWAVNRTGETDKVDSLGFFTGEKIPTYGDPFQIRLHLYPSNSSVVERMFGRDASFDMIAVSTDVVLDENTLLFEFTPTGDYMKTHDYSVSRIAKSVNTYGYGLKRRS